MYESVKQGQDKMKGMMRELEGEMNIQKVKDIARLSLGGHEVKVEKLKDIKDMLGIKEDDRVEFFPDMEYPKPVVRKEEVKLDQKLKA